MLIRTIVWLVVCALVISAIPACAVITLASQRLTFEVASIKENRSGTVESFAYPYAATGRLRLVNQTTRQIIRQAYDVRNYQLVGGPDWLDRVRYDIEAKAANPVTRQQLMQMLQSLLEDAFKVVVQRRTRDGGILALRQATTGKLGPNITAATPADARLNPVGAQPDGLRGSAATMADLAAVLSNLQGTHVVDQTGLAGIFNFTVTFGTQERMRPPGVPADALPPPRQDLPALPTALIEQLGLRLESARGAIPILIIERAQQPMVDGYSTTADPN